MRNPIAILGIPIDDLDTEKALLRLDEFVASRRFHQVATANTDFLIQALADPELKSILWGVDLIVPDGMPLIFASRWLGKPLKERVTGADLVPLLAQRAAEKGYRVFLLGGKRENAQAARARLEQDNPGLQIVGCLSPPPSHIVTMDNEAILAEIEAASPDILLVAFGNPKQEKWIHMHRERLQVPVCIGVGGTLDFLAGATQRAPLWMQRSGMEWLHRLSQEPRRLWRRYCRDLVQFSRFLLLQLWVMRRRSPVAAHIVESRSGDCTVMSLIGSLDVGLVPRLQERASQALQVPTHLVFDLQATASLDSAVLGTLLNLPKRAAFVGREVRLVGVPPHLKDILSVAQVQSRLKVFPTFADALRGEGSGALEIRLEQRADAIVLIVEGAARVENRSYLENYLKQLPEAAPTIELDLRGVTFMDSSCLALLHRFAELRNRTGGRVSLRPGVVIGSLLEREKLANLFVLA